MSVHPYHTRSDEMTPLLGILVRNEKARKLLKDEVGEIGIIL